MSTPETGIRIAKISLHTLSSPPAHHVGSPPSSFINPWPSFHQHSPFELIISSIRNRDFKPIPSKEQLVSVQTPDWGNGKVGLQATWLGHATFLIEARRPEDGDRGIRVLFDPVFSERTSPVSFAGPKRYSPVPCSLDELPDVDIIAISHDHYDHMDSDTLIKIYRKNPNVHFLVALGNARRLRGFGIAADSIMELDWWEGASLNFGERGSMTMTCTPSQHFSGRGIIDHGSTLWCSWVLVTKDIDLNPNNSIDQSKRLFFAGDTGYRYVPKGSIEDEMPCCPTFKQIGETFGPFDLSLLPIGLYAPRHLLSPLHCTPEDALSLHRDLRSRKSIGMHYGTFRGGISQYFEEVTEPPRRYREACEKDGKIWGENLDLLDIGETLVI